MRINFHKSFVKHFDKRIKPNRNLLRKFNIRYKNFIKNRRQSILKDHKLTGAMQGKRAFSITGDIRIVYRQLDEDTIEFLDIGTHAQVYGE